MYGSGWRFDRELHDGVNNPAPGRRTIMIAVGREFVGAPDIAPARKLPRSLHEGVRDTARDTAATDAYVASRCERKKIEMLFAPLKRIVKLDRLRLRGSNGAHDEFHLAAQNLRRLAMLIPAPIPMEVETGEGDSWAVATYGRETVETSFREMGGAYRTGTAA